MASFDAGLPDAQGGMEPSAAMYNIHLSMPVPSINTAGVADNGDGDGEWEYEYSTTETETFYLTLDLTTPSIPQNRSHSAAKVSRGAHKTNWTNPGLGRNKRQLGRNPVISLPSAGLVRKADTATPQADSDLDAEGETDLDVDMEEPEPEQELEPVEGGDGDGDGEVGGGEGVQTTQPTTQEAAQDTEETREIQILDLHTENPIIQYKNHTFSCHWATNIGTELLFTEHDDANPLPVLRSLEDKVDLLAASSARIVSKSITLTPNFLSHANESGRGTAGRGRGQAAYSGYLSASVGKGASDTRKDQAKFLEQLMGVKANRGEDDAVTVITQRRLSSQQWQRLLHKSRNDERRQLRTIIKAGGSKGVDARNRLQIIDEEDALRERNKRSAPGSDSGSGKRPRGTIRRPRGGWEAYRHAQSRGVSRPTPGSWDELYGGQNGEGSSQGVHHGEGGENSSLPPQEHAAADDFGDRGYHGGWRASTLAEAERGAVGLGSYTPSLDMDGLGEEDGYGVYGFEDMDEEDEVGEDEEGDGDDDMP